VRQHGDTQSVVALDRNPVRAGRSIGVEIIGGGVVVLIAEGSRTPVAHAMTFTTVADGQKAVEIRVSRLESGGSSTVGRFLLIGVRAAPRGEARIDIGMSLDSAGVLHAWAADRSTGARQEVYFPGSWAISPESRGEAFTSLSRRVEHGAGQLPASSALRGAVAAARSGAAASRSGVELADAATALATIAGEMAFSGSAATGPAIRINGWRVTGGR
jgi:hypothetical protein